jgi:hypothetical protein
MGAMRNARRNLVGESEGKGRLARLRHRWDDIKVDITEIGDEGVDWIHMAQNSNQ